MRLPRSLRSLVMTKKEVLASPSSPVIAGFFLCHCEASANLRGGDVGTGFIPVRNKGDHYAQNSYCG
jgi:hypothetical protein